MCVTMQQQFKFDIFRLVDNFIYRMNLMDNLSQIIGKRLSMKNSWMALINFRRRTRERNFDQFHRQMTICDSPPSNVTILISGQPFGFIIFPNFSVISSLCPGYVELTYSNLFCAANSV